MTTVTCSMYALSDTAEALAVEDIYRKWASFAGVQSFKFDSDIAAFVGANWTNPTGHLTFAGGVLARTSDTSLGGTDIAWYTPPLPHSYVLEFTAHEAAWMLLLRGDKADHYYYIDYNGASSGKIRLKKQNGAAVSLLDEKELAGAELAPWGRVRIAVRDAQFTSDSNGRIIYISVWLNENLLIAFQDIVPTNNPPLFFGFMVLPGLEQTVYSDLRLPNMGEIVIWSSLDPSENPMGAISRALEDRYVRQWVRWDGSLKAWRPRARTLARQIDTDLELSLAPALDIKQIFTRVRVVGAFQWVQVTEPALTRRFGMRFREINNTAAWNADDCDRLGREILLRVQEQADQVNFVTYGLHFLEPEDRIQVPDHQNPGSFVDYIIDTLRWDYEGGTFRAAGTARRYLYGEP